MDLEKRRIHCVITHTCLSLEKSWLFSCHRETQVLPYLYRPHTPEPRLFCRIRRKDIRNVCIPHCFSDSDDMLRCVRHRLKKTNMQSTSLSRILSEYNIMIAQTNVHRFFRSEKEATKTLPPSLIQRRNSEVLLHRNWSCRLRLTKSMHKTNTYKQISANMYVQIPSNVDNSGREKQARNTTHPNKGGDRSLLLSEREHLDEILPTPYSRTPTSSPSNTWGL